MPSVKRTNNNSKIPNNMNNLRTTLAFQNYLQSAKERIFNRFRLENWSENGIDSCIFILLIGLGMFIRVVLAYDFRLYWGFGSDENIWNWYVDFNINNIETRGYADFNFYYHSWITAWFEGTWYPYQWHDAPETSVLDFYSYPPVFLYFLVLTWRPGMSNFWMAFPMVLSDAMCAGFVYLILKNIIPQHQARGIAFIGGILMAIAPINILYDGIYWLNPGPVTLMTIIAFYFAVKNKWWQAFFWLAIATMTKQNALFFTFPLFMIMIGEKLKKKSVTETVIESIMNAVLFVTIALLLSIPWIFISPTEYVRHMLFPGRPIEIRFDPVIPVSNDCVSLAYSIYFLKFPQWIVGIVSFGNYSMFWMILSSCIISVYMMWRTYNKKMDGVEFFEWIAVYTIFTHVFMPRGVYKFYTAYYIPMILIALLGSLSQMTKANRYLPFGLTIACSIFFGFNFWLLTIPREASTFFIFMVSLVLIVICLIRSFIREQALKIEANVNLIKYLDQKIGM